MPLTRQKKEEIVKELTDALRGALSVVFVNFHGLSVSDVNEMRQEFKKQGINYTVMKKTLARRVLDKFSFEGEPPLFDGELAIAYGSDLVLPAKSIVEFQKKFEDRIMPLGGVLEMKYITAEEIKKLSAIPSREVLYGQFATVINAPIQKTVCVLNNVISSFVIALDQISQSKA